VLALAACRSDQATAPPSPPPPPPIVAAPAADAPDPPCAQLDFAATTPVPEASGAAWLELGGKPALLVNSDSGNDGAYAIVDAETGTTLEEGKLPLGGGSGDIEGLASRGGVIYGLSSSGWVIAWKRAAKGFEVTSGPYALAAESTGLTCEKGRTNCGPNYEGLAIAPGAPAGGCVGYACSKKQGRMFCLTEKDGRFAIDGARSLEVLKPDALGDCAFSPEGALYVAANFFGGSRVLRIDDWADPATAKVVEIAELGMGFPEVVAAGGDVIYRMSDTGGAPSLMAKFRCRSIAR
jgi:hypothetical protein